MDTSVCKTQTQVCKIENIIKNTFYFKSVKMKMNKVMVNALSNQIIMSLSHERGLKTDSKSE